MIRNEALKFIMPGDRDKINIPRWFRNESVEHKQMKQDICNKLYAEGKSFICEARLTGMVGRADIVCLDDMTIIEVVKSESEESILLKNKKYPKQFKLVVAKC